MLGIIIPVYNRADKLKEALESLKLQIMKRFIVCVVDDASTEDIQSVVKDFQDCLNISYIRKEVNGGTGAARQEGLNWARRLNIELIMFLDGDDLLFPNATYVLTSEINHGRYDMVASDIAVEHQHDIQTITSAEHSITWFHGKIYRVASLNQHNINFTTELRTNEDLEFNLKVYWSCENCSYINTSVYIWRDEKNSLTRILGPSRNAAKGLDYIKAIYNAVMFAKNLKRFSLSFAMPNIMSMYNYYQFMLIRGEEITADIDELIIEIFDLPEFKKLTAKATNWENWRDYIWHYVLSDQKELKFFPESFEHWYLNHGGII